MGPEISTTFTKNEMEIKKWVSAQTVTLFQSLMSTYFMKDFSQLQGEKQ